MNELEKLQIQEQKLREKKKQLLAKEYSRLGRAFYKKAKVKSFEEAQQAVTNYQPGTSKVTNEQVKKLTQFANNLTWNESGNYWYTNEVKELTQFLAQFREEV